MWRVRHGQVWRSLDEDGAADTASVPMCAAGTWLRARNTSSSACKQPDVLLYIGADLDLQLLALMQPWETTAVFVDPLENDAILHNLTRNYERKHEMDPRPAWRQSSLPFRPCHQLSCAEPLTWLLHDRMVQDPAQFARVRVIGNLSISFELQQHRGIGRTLRYVVDLSENDESTFAEFQGRVSTMAAPGAAGNLGPSHFGTGGAGLWSPWLAHHDDQRREQAPQKTGPRPL